jgi:hypothetical protein
MSIVIKTFFKISWVIFQSIISYLLDLLIHNGPYM